jgi:hypothetical protein
MNDNEASTRGYECGDRSQSNRCYGSEYYSLVQSQDTSAGRWTTFRPRIFRAFPKPSTLQLQALNTSHRAFPRAANRLPHPVASTMPYHLHELPCYALIIVDTIVVVGQHLYRAYPQTAYFLNTLSDKMRRGAVVLLAASFISSSVARPAKSKHGIGGQDHSAQQYLSPGAPEASHSHHYHIPAHHPAHLEAAPNSIGLLFTTSETDEVTHVWLPLDTLVHTRKFPFSTPHTATHDARC